MNVITSELGGLNVILKAMKSFPDTLRVQEVAMGSLWNPLRISEAVRVQFTESGGIELVAKCMLRYKDNAGIQNEGYAPLLFMTESEDERVRLAFLQSPSALPALNQVLASIPPWWNMRAMTLDLKHEKVSEAIGKLGLMEISMIGDDQFDGDDEEDEWCHVRDAPFDAQSLINMDLVNDDVAGWYNAYPFHLDYQYAIKCEKESGKKFLAPATVPIVGQSLCLRVKIPNGGRGHLFGRVTEVGGEIPSKEELASSGTQSECALRDARTRDELLAVSRTLHGHVIVGEFSLNCGNEFETREKLRHSPLVPFFRGEDTKYCITLQFNDAVRDWEVVRITAEDNA